ncbi:class F sortase [Cellulomonas sp. HZM]|uniref:class F sortase n=1 Tax=Cellulomonas sp. HZM TaxID=1454010 RepID=UPI0006908A24|nr:class F sortase [Cellulomonas sp. HZM]
MDADGARTPGHQPGRGRRRVAAVVVGAGLLAAGGAAVTTALAAQLPAPPTPAASAAPSSRDGAAGAGRGVPAPGPSATPDDRGAAPTSAASAPAGAPSAAATGVPRPQSVSIPSLHVSSRLLTLGLASDGTIAVPAKGPNYDRAAWFDGSPRPGAVGPAVIEGHVDGANGPSVFHELGRIQKGARIDVTRTDGSVVRFVVDGVASYPKDDFPITVVYANTDRPELRLITCGGAFDRRTGHYVDNTVVFAHLA